MVLMKPSVRLRPVLEKIACLAWDCPLVFRSAGSSEGTAPAVPLTLRASGLFAIILGSVLGEVVPFLRLASAICRADRTDWCGAGGEWKGEEG